jgi:hypothetical protein
MTGSAGPAFAILESIESTSQKVLVKIAFWSDPDKTRKGTPRRGVRIAAKLGRKLFDARLLVRRGHQQTVGEAKKSCVAKGSPTDPFEDLAAKNLEKKP